MTRLFFGDRERAFALPLPQLEELERVTGSTFGAIYHRVRTLHFSYADLAETVRLALIGGGETAPKEAADLIAPYVAARPLMETWKVALPVLETAMFGSVTTPEGPDGTA